MFTDLLKSKSAQIGVLACVGLLLTLVLVLVLLVPTKNGGDVAESGMPVDPVIRRMSLASRQLSQSVGASVVRIEVERDPLLVNEELQQLFGGTGLPSSAQGSGIVVSSDGYVLTNYHVVANADEFHVSSESKQFKGRLVGTDALTDLALLIVDELEQPAIKWGDSDQVATGDFVWAIGNPFGLRRSVSFGIISAVEQDTVAATIYQNFFQTDAVLNPGNSGGPVVNDRGEVIGISTAIVGESFRGISFAIPSNTAREVFEQLKQAGRVRRGWLGVRLDDLSTTRAHELGIVNSGGAVVSALTGQPGETTPARAAGLRKDDVITQWNDAAIDSSVRLGRLVAQAEIGQAARLQLLREGRPLTIEIKVGERP